MIEQILMMKLAVPDQVDHIASRLRQECEVSKRLFEEQPMPIQQYLRTQAASIAEALRQGVARFQFTLPAELRHPQTKQGAELLEALPAKYRQQSVHRMPERLMHSNILNALCDRLDTLESSTNRSVAFATGLLRFATSFQLIYHTLPAGKSVVYATPQDEDIPNQPVGVTEVSKPASQRAMWDAEGDRYFKGADGDTPYVAAARRFYMPQWVAFDEQGQLLVNSENEAEDCLASMQKYMEMLKWAVEIAPYMITDEVCQQKRYGMLGQLVNQGRWLARYELHEMIRIIQRRVAGNNLNRGLSLNLPYFNDQTMKLESSYLEIIPKGRVMYVPAFMVLAVRAQGARVAQDTRLSLSTRRYLLAELGALEKEFTR
jgi:hypothetical protein